mmetsp:Transcript_26565/g.48159  ORF Transcript_26565/g.48159 Transcript_26565/m.48159 type:complete len:286 (+) Transcript_26565:129-986(+)
MDDRVNCNVDDDASNASFEVERGVPILNLNMSHVTEEDPDVEEVYNEDNHATRSPSVEVVNEKLSKLEDPEVNDTISNDNLSVEDSVHDDDGPGGPNVATSSMSKRKKCALALITSVALLALIIGLSVGLTGKNNDAQERSASSANSALTLEDCLAEAAATGSVPTSMPTDNSNFPTYDYASVESGEDDAAIGQSSMLADEFVATGISNDIPVEEEEIPSEETGEAVSSEEPPRPSNDVDDIDFLVRRDLRGNIKRSPIANKVKEHTPASKSRRLQCQELLAGGL